MNAPQPVATVDTTEAAVPAVVFHSVVMPISITVGKERRFHHFLDYNLPTLEMVNPELPAPDKWEETIQTEGDKTATILRPVYDNPVYEFIQTSLTQRIQGIARSKDKAGVAIPSDWIELFETSGGTKYPVQLKEFKAGLAEWLGKQENLTEVQRAAILSYTDTKQLQEATSAKKARVEAMFTQFITSLGDKANEYSSVIANINRALEVNPEDIAF